MVTITSPKSVYVDNNDSSTYTLKWTAVTGQTAFEVLYKLRTSDTWQTAGKILSTDTSYDLRQIYSLLGIDFQEISYKLCVYTTVTSENVTSTGYEYSEVYQLIFNQGPSGELNIYSGGATTSYPVFSKVSNPNLEYLNINSNGIKKIPLVPESSPLASKMAVKTPKGIRFIAGKTTNIRDYYTSQGTPVGYFSAYVNQYYNTYTYYSYITSYRYYTAPNTYSSYSYPSAYRYYTAPNTYGYYSYVTSYRYYTAPNTYSSYSYPSAYRYYTAPNTYGYYYYATGAYTSYKATIYSYYKYSYSFVNRTYVSWSYGYSYGAYGYGGHVSGTNYGYSVWVPGTYVVEGYKTEETTYGYYTYRTEGFSYSVSTPGGTFYGYAYRSIPEFHSTTPSYTTVYKYDKTYYYYSYYNVKVYAGAYYIKTYKYLTTPSAYAYKYYVTSYKYLSEPNTYAYNSKVTGSVNTSYNYYYITKN